MKLNIPSKNPRSATVRPHIRGDILEGGHPSLAKPDPRMRGVGLVSILDTGSDAVVFTYSAI